MTIIDAIILGILQGITEFLPVSSSGHLTLAQHLLSFKNLNEYIIFDLVCHLGTLLAVCLVFKNQIKSLFISNSTQLYQVALGTLMLVPLLFILKPIKNLFNEPQYLGYFFMFTAFILWIGVRFSKISTSESLQKNTWRDSIIIGLFQAIAILPGISRSGSTISAARLLGWKPSDAVLFSFLLAIPAIAGGTLLELMQIASKGGSASLSQAGTIHYVIGFITSFVVGYGALLLLMQLVVKDKLLYFSWYCLALGVGTWAYFNLNTGT